MKAISPYFKTLTGERGIAMIVAMIVLLILTVIGVAATKTAIYDTLTSTAEKRKRIAFYAAEAGIEHARASIGTYLQQPKPGTATATWKKSLLTGAATAANHEVPYPDIKPNTAIGTDYTYTVWVKNNNDGSTPDVDVDGQVIIRSDSKSRTPDGGSASVEVILNGDIRILGDAVQEKTGQALHGSLKSNTSDDLNPIDVNDLKKPQATGIGVPK
jgi:Tfp pilus assembly protein PilV